MNPEKIISVTAEYQQRFLRDSIMPQRIDPLCTFAETSLTERLAHAAYLAEHIPDFARDPGKWGKANRHLASMQLCMSFAGWYSLNELREHNMP